MNNKSPLKVWYQFIPFCVYPIPWSGQVRQALKDLEPFGTAAGTGSPEGQAALLNNHVPDNDARMMLRGSFMKMNEQSKGELVACLLSMS